MTDKLTKQTMRDLISYETTNEDEILSAKVDGRSYSHVLTQQLQNAVSKVDSDHKTIKTKTNLLTPAGNANIDPHFQDVANNIFQNLRFPIIEHPFGPDTRIVKARNRKEQKTTQKQSTILSPSVEEALTNTKWVPPIVSAAIADELDVYHIDTKPIVETPEPDPDLVPDSELFGPNAAPVPPTPESFLGYHQARWPGIVQHERSEQLFTVIKGRTILTSFIQEVIEGGTYVTRLPEQTTNYYKSKKKEKTKNLGLDKGQNAFQKMLDSRKQTRKEFFDQRKEELKMQAEIEAEWLLAKCYDVLNNASQPVSFFHAIADKQCTPRVATITLGKLTPPKDTSDMTYSPVHHSLFEEMSSVLTHIKKGYSWESLYNDSIEEHHPMFTAISIPQYLGYLWSIRIEDRQSLVHALNGNTSVYLDNDIYVTGVGIPSIPLVQHATRLVGNSSTKRTYRWDSMELTIDTFGLSVILLNEVAYLFLVLSMDGSVPADYDFAAPNSNSGNNKLLAARTVPIAPLANATVFYNVSRTVYLPPGSSIWAITMNVPGSNFPSNMDVTVALIGGLYPESTDITYTPYTVKLPTRGSNIIPTVYVRDLQGKLYTLKDVRDINDIKKSMKERFPDNIRIATYTKDLKSSCSLVAQGVYDGMTLTLKGRLPGGSDKETYMASEKELAGTSAFEKLGASTPVGSAVLFKNGNTQLPVTSENTIKDSLLTDIADKIVAVATSKMGSHIFQGSYTSPDSILSQWAAMMTSTNVKDNDVGDTTGAAEWRESFFARKFIQVATTLDYNTIESYRYLNNSLPCKTAPYDFSKAIGELDIAMKTGDLILSSQTVRINTSMSSGDVYQQILSEAGPKYRGNYPVSFVSRLTKMFLYLNGEYPLMGIENAAVQGNLHATLVPGSRDVAPIYFPFTLGSSVRPVLNARVIDARAFATLRAGTNTNPVPIGWEMSTWGVDTCVIGVQADMCNRPPILASYILGCTEYPFLQRQYTMQLTNDQGIDLATTVTNIPQGDQTLVPGPRLRFLFVITNMFAQAAGNDISVQLGTVGAGLVTLNLATNSFTGVPVDISPALQSVMLNADGNFPMHMFNAIGMFKRFLSTPTDTSAAFLLAADLAYNITHTPMVRPRTTALTTETPLNSYVAASGISWNATGLTQPSDADLARLAKSYSSPWCFTDVIVPNLTTLTAHATRFCSPDDPIAGVDMTMGIIAFIDRSSSEREFPATILEFLGRIRTLSRLMHNYMDTMLSSVDISGNSLFDPIRSSGVPGAIAPVSGIGLTTVYNKWIQIFKGISAAIGKVGPLPMEYRVGASLNNQYAFFSTNTGLVSCVRSPLYYLTYNFPTVGDMMTQSYVIPKTEQRGLVTLLPTTSERIEIFDVMPKGIRDLSMQSWTMLLQDCVMTGATPTTTRHIPDLWSAAPGISIKEPLILRWSYPSESIGQMISLLNYFPPTAMITAIKDLPNCLLPPTWDVLTNTRRKFLFTSYSKWYTKISRVQLNYFSLRLVTLADSAQRTQEVVGDGDADQNSAALDF